MCYDSGKHVHTNACHPTAYCSSEYSYKNDDGDTIVDYHGTCPYCGGDVCRAWTQGNAMCSRCYGACTNEINSYSLICGYTEGAIESATIIFAKN